jgi:hypothetical protein
MQVPSHHCRTADNAMRADSGTAGNSDTTGYRRMSTDAHIVSNLNLIIQFHAIFYHGIDHHTSIDRRVSSNLYIVADHDPSQMRHFEPAVVIECAAKPVSANYATRVHNRPHTDHAAIVYRNIGMQLRIAPNNHVRPDTAARANAHALTDPSALINRHESRYLGAMSYLSQGVH